MTVGNRAALARAVEQRLAAAHAAARGDHLGPIRVDAAREPRDVRGRRDRQVLRRSQRRVRRPIHERVQQRAARSLLAFDARHVRVQPGQLELQPQDVLQAAVSGPLVQPGELQDARGEPDVLQVEAQLLIGAVVARVRAPYLGGDFLAARARGVLRARRVLGRRAPARIERSPGGEGLAHAQHQRVRLVERVRARERHAPLLVLGLEIGQPRGRLASRLGGPGARLVLGDLRVPLERDAQDGLEAGAPRQLGVVTRRGAGVQRGQNCE